MFLGGIPEAAASATMLCKAGYSDRTIFLLWATVLATGVVAAVAGKLLIGGAESTTAVLVQAVTGGAILALVTHAMIPEALHKGGSVRASCCRRWAVSCSRSISLFEVVTT